MPELDQKRFLPLEVFFKNMLLNLRPLHTRCFPEHEPSCMEQNAADLCGETCTMAPAECPSYCYAESPVGKFTLFADLFSSRHALWGDDGWGE
jgi:hypothetical protein